MKFILATLAVAAALVSAQAQAVNIFACEPEWGALAGEIAGEKGNIYSATTAGQDPHHIEARPSLISRIRNADLLICSGAELEVGWLPLLITQSGNGRIQAGSQGYLEAAQYVTRLEVPTNLDRSLGDIHPGGNPHIHTNPRNIAKVAAALTERLAAIDSPNAQFYSTRSKDFLTRWNAAIARWEQQAAPLKGLPVVVHHKEWSYMEAWLGMREVGTLEPKPGLPPTPGHLAELVDTLKRDPVKAIIYAPHNDPSAARFLSQKSGAPAVLLPFTVGGSDRAKDLFGLFDDSIAKLLAVAH